MATDTKILKSFLELYKSWELSIIPIAHKSKKPLVKWEGYKELRPNASDLEEWFGNGQLKNIGIVCGNVSSNLVVLDFDSEVSFEEFSLGQPQLYESTPIVKTSRGYHIYLRTREPVKSQKLDGIDIKGEGGFVLAPPSIHPDGIAYQFKNPDVTEILQINSLEDIGINIKKPDEPYKDPSWVSQLLEQGVSEGARNDSAARLAGYFRNLVPQDITEHILLEWNNRNTPPLPEDELRRTIASVYRLPEHVPYNNGIYNSSFIYSPYSSDLATKRDKSVTESVTKSLPEQDNVTLSKRIEGWVSDTNGWFSYEDCDKDIGIRDSSVKENRRQIFKRLREAGKIEAHPTNNKLFRHVNTAVRLIDFKSATRRTPLALKFPFEIENKFNCYPGNIIVLAGAADSGKTAFLLNFIRLNMYDFNIYYQSSEMGKDELASRLENFEGLSLDEWNFQAEERSRDFADVIRPDCINVIDYMEIAKDFHIVADYLRQIHDKLKGGIAIVALQKKRGSELGRGGDFGLEKPRLYLSMDKGKLTIQKAKNWVNHTENPNGLSLDFKVIKGCEFIVTRDWYHPPI